MLETPAIRDTYDKYISLLSGFMTAPDGVSDDSKLRYTTKFFWSDSLTKMDIITSENWYKSIITKMFFNYFRDVQDAQFEICCMTMNVAMWYTKHAAYVAGKSST